MKDTKKKRRMRLPNGIGSVHKIGDGKNRRNPWRARVPDRMDFDLETGKCTQKYITIGYFPSEKEAIAALFEYQRNPYTADAATVTFAEVYEMWKARKFPSLSGPGQKMYIQGFYNSKSLHDMRMRDIRTKHLENIMQSMKAGYGTQKHTKTLWHQLFNYAMEHDIVQKNYAKFVATKDTEPVTSRTDIPLEDRQKIWKRAVAGDWAAQMLMIYIYTGMRSTELLELKKENVDLEARIIVDGKKTKAGIDRRIPVHRSIIPFLEQLMQTPGEYLVEQPAKGVLKRVTYIRWDQCFLKPFMQENNMSYTTHYTRHTCATMLREANVEEDLRKLILGHANGDITDRYTHHSDAMLLEAIDRLPAME